jgi:hypothetical protein
MTSGGEQRKKNNAAPEPDGGAALRDLDRRKQDRKPRRAAFS